MVSPIPTPSRLLDYRLDIGKLRFWTWTYPAHGFGLSADLYLPPDWPGWSFLFRGALWGGISVKIEWNPI